MNVANAYNESFNIRAVRFGDNMRSVAVTEGDKIQAQIDFGWTVDYFPINDLVKEVNKVSKEEINKKYQEYVNKYGCQYDKYSKET
jgi:L-arabinose isomerase